MSENKDITEIARKQRYLTLLKKVKGGQSLSKGELAELEQFQDAGGTPTTQLETQNSKLKTCYRINCADAQRLGYESADIAAADIASKLNQNLFDYLSRHPKMRAAYDRGRLLRQLAISAPNCLIYEAARQLKDLGFSQFQSGQDLRDFLDKDPEANELWESARVNGAIENRQSLRETANNGNVKAIELLEKWSADRQRETGEVAGENFGKVTTNQMAELFGVTRQTIYDWKTQRGLQSNIDDTYDLHTALLWFEDYVQKKVVRGNNAVSSLNPFQAVKTKREELKLQEDIGELIPRTIVIGTWQAQMQNVVNAFNGITDLANRIFSQEREEIVQRLEDFRDEIFTKIQHVPAELKLTAEAENKLQELFELLKPENTGNRIQETENENKKN
jgi:hypothetical protein